nr:hypothetical protein [Tanacetum cinerariifolium]
MLPVASPSPDYIPGLEEPHTPPAPQNKDEHEPMFIQPHDRNFVPEPIYPEYIPLEDEHILPAEEQPLPPVGLPTAESPRYVAESDPEEDPKEYEDDETKDGPVDYPMDGGDDGDDDDDNLSRDNADDEDEDVEDEEEDEHLASTDSATEMPPHKRLCLSTLVSRYEVKDSSTTRPTGGQRIDYGFVSTLDAEARRRGIGEVGYGIRDTWIDPAETVPEIVPMTVGEIAEDEAYDAREAWAHSIGLSQVAHSELQTHQEQASGTDDRDSLSDGRHETRDGRHADRVVSTI